MSSDYSIKIMKNPRWLVEVDYRTVHGTVTVDHHIEELHELHMKAEPGPDWNTIEQIRIVLNPKRASFPGETIEASLRR
jgi:hypothetical protein